MSNALGTSAPIFPSSRPVIDDTTHNDTKIRCLVPDIIPNTPSDLAISCMAIIEERPKGHLTLASVTLQLVDLLPDHDAGNETYRSYLNQLTKIDHKCALASSGGKTTTKAVTTHDLQLINDQTPNGTCNTVLQGDLIPTTIKCMFNHNHGPSTRDTQESSTNKSLYAWSNMPVPATSLDADVSKTLALKANYLTDIHHAKNNLII